MCPVCDLKYALVCGDNGKTYGSKCLMEAEACEQKKVIKRVKDGACGKRC